VKYRLESILLNIQQRYMISGFHRELDENCALLGYYAASSGNFLPTFGENLSEGRQLSLDSWPLPETRRRSEGEVHPMTSLCNHRGEAEM